MMTEQMRRWRGSQGKGREDMRMSVNTTMKQQPVNWTYIKNKKDNKKLTTRRGQQ